MVALTFDRSGNRRVGDLGSLVNPATNQLDLRRVEPGALGGILEIKSPPPEMASTSRLSADFPATIAGPLLPPAKTKPG